MIDPKVVLRHREPFLFIDYVQYIIDGEICAVKAILKGDYILQGHFPGDPVFPGVLIVEMMAQAASILEYKPDSKPMNAYLVRIKNAEYKKKVEPNSILKVFVKRKELRHSLYTFEAEARSDRGVIYAKAEFCLFLTEN